MHSAGLDVKASKPVVVAAAASRPRREWGRGFRLLRGIVLIVAGLAVGVGVLWLRRETPNPRGSVADREATPVEARSLKALLKPVTTPQAVSFAARKDPAGPGAKAVPQGPAVAEQARMKWPREVELKEPATVGEVFQDPKTKVFISRTKHFEFACDVPLGPEVVRHFAGTFETTHLLHCLLPLDLKPAPEAGQKLFRVCVLGTEAAFVEAGGKRGSGGFYHRSDKCLYVTMASVGVKMVGPRVVLDRSIEANDTLSREITRQMMNRWLPLLPMWFTEGAAEYVAAAELVRGKFLLGQMQDRLKGRRRDDGSGTMALAMLGVPELLAMTQQAWKAGKDSPVAAENDVSTMLLTFYLWHLDREGEGAGSIALLRAVEKGMPHEEAVKEFLLAGRTPEQLEAEMGKVFAGLGVELSFTRRGGKVFTP